MIPTYCALSDYANNKSGLCWPKMQTLAKTLNRSVRTIQRHLHLLREAGAIEFVERRRHKGRFSSYLYRILFIATTGHTRRVGKRSPNKRRTKPSKNNPQTPTNDPVEGYWWLFGEQAPPDKQEEYNRQQQKKREEEAKRRREGYEWFFKER